jgi:NADH-quinone oxidoreductase subunit N
MNAIIITAIWGVLLMFSSVFVKSKTAPLYIAIAGIVLAMIVNCMELTSGGPLFSLEARGLFQVNALGLMFNNIAFAGTLLYFLLSGRDIMRVGSSVGEYFALLFFVLCGVTIASSFNSLLMLFLGIEIISIPLYILTGSDKRNLKSNEASLKYFLMGAFSTGIMLMGIAFLYGASANGSFLLGALNLGAGPMPTMAAVGMVLMLISLSFKVSAAPFHFWTPDVYDGAPTVFTSFMATIVKAASFMAFVRLFDKSFGAIQPQWQALIAVLTAATLLIGNITAVFQQSVKRMLAYSSIAQAGFMLFALFALNDKAKDGLILYAAAYSLATIGLFAILIKMKDYTVDGFNGLSKTQPLMAVTAVVFLLSLTGVPPTAGFISKFYMLMAAAENGRMIWLVILAVLCAAISAYYYFRVIQAMFFKAPSATGESTSEAVSPAFKALLVVTAILLLIIGLYPEMILYWVHSY